MEPPLPFPVLGLRLPLELPSYRLAEPPPSAISHALIAAVQFVLVVAVTPTTASLGAAYVSHTVPTLRLLCPYPRLDHLSSETLGSRCMQQHYSCSEVPCLMPMARNIETEAKNLHAVSLTS